MRDGIRRRGVAPAAGGNFGDDLGVGGTRATTCAPLAPDSLRALLTAPLEVRCPEGAPTLVLAVVCLSAADAFLTLRLLLLGAVEVNPFMSVLMGQSTQSFVSWKLLVTTAAALFLLMVFDLRPFPGITVRRLLEATVVGYACLVIYESALLIALS